jgi:hypothetical protein
VDVREFLDDTLLRALRQGPEALPDDAGRLLHYLRLIDQLLAEKATEQCASWREICAAAAEIETLQQAQLAIGERAIGVTARDVTAVQLKLEIWSQLPCEEDCREGVSVRDRLIVSVHRDLHRLQRQVRSTEA